MAKKIGEIRLSWIASASFTPVSGEPLPISVLGPQCVFRKYLVQQLEDANMPYRIAATSPSLDGLWAAVLGGLGVTARTKLALPDGVVYCDSLFGLPALGSFPITLHRHPAANTQFDRMIELLVDELTQKLQNTRKALPLQISRKA